MLHVCNQHYNIIEQRDASELQVDADHKAA
jgi:hypothetical protein